MRALAILLTISCLAAAGCAAPAPVEEDPWSDILREYLRMYPYKALAIGDDSHGFSVGAPTPEAAIVRALRSCEEYAQVEPSGCTLWALGQRVVEDLAPDLLQREIDLYRVRVIGGLDVEVEPDSPELRVPLVEDYIE
ncbi:MAG TPA: hypothetical protein VKB65_07115 [Myxococcota bacterium]|nr:hypothetical protein [Myxococcota bacterium]